MKLLIAFLMMATSSALYDFKINSLDGKSIDFSQYKGKILLIVNTASECGYTPQYADLQEFASGVNPMGNPILK